MYPIIRTCKVKGWNGKQGIKNVCLVNGREAVWYMDGYYYIDKQKRIGKERAKI